MLEMALGGDPAKALQKQQQQILQKQQEEQEEEQEEEMVDDGGDYVELVDDRVQNGEINANGVQENPENETQVTKSPSPPPNNPWKDQPKHCKPNYSVPKTLSKVPLPPSPPSERRPKKPSPPATPNPEVLKLIEDQINQPKPKTYETVEMDEVRLQSANKVLKVYDEQDVDWASGAVRACDRVSKHVQGTDGGKMQIGPDLEIDYLDYQDTYDITVLQSQKMRLPKGIDRSQLQNYLDEDQFEAAFHMSPGKFDSLPLWKKTNLKKSLYLF